MADVLLIEDKVDNKTESTENCNQIPESWSKMTQKQEESDADTLSTGDLVVNPDDLLPPVLKLEKYATSDIVFNRQVVARNLLETLRLVAGNADELTRVVIILCNLAEDYEPSVRAELIQQLPHIASFFSECDYQLGHLIHQYIVPMLVNHLTDINIQARKTSQASLLLMVEQNLVDIGFIESKLCSRILRQTESNYMDDLRTEAVTFMSKLSPLIGKDATERLFLERFLNLCLDSSFHVRKVCAENFGEICTIVERETTEKQLLPKFYFLCEDSVWGVRKVCAEVFMPISCVCSMETRHKELAPVYMNLLCDQSKWVRMAAFQALGPFISTFAEPSKTGLYYDKEGILTVVDVPCDESKKNSSNVKSEGENDTSSKEASSKDTNSKETSHLPNSCDSVVPSLKSNKVSDSYIQSTMCHLGNYCTVIELNSSNCNANDASASITNGCHDSKYTNCDHSDVGVLKESGRTLLKGIGDVKSSNVSILHGSNKLDSCNHSKNIDCNLYDSHGQPSLGEVKVLKTDVCNGEVADRILAADLDNYLESRALNGQETRLSNSSFSSIIVVGKGVPSDTMVNGFSDSLTADLDPVLPSPSFISDVSVSEEKPLFCGKNLTSNQWTVKHEKNTDHVEWLNNTEEITDCRERLSVPEKQCTLYKGVSSDSSLEHEKNPHNVSNSDQRDAALCGKSDLLPANVDGGEKSAALGELEEVGTKISVDDCVFPESESAFNHFQYWRMPLPTVDVDAIPEEIQSTGKTNSSVRSSKDCERSRRSCLISQHYISSSNISSETDLQSSGSEADVQSSGPEGYTKTSLCGSLFEEKNEQNCENAPDSPTKTKVDHPSSQGVSNVDCNNLCTVVSKEFHLSDLSKSSEAPLSMQNLFSAHDQDIVPPELLLRYLSMTDASRAQSVDAEIARHCAYSLPAVALTLGRRFWPCLKETYNTLASDMQGFIMQWKVRRTLASSMHQLAVILGPDIAARDLLPIFSGFIKDLDEVRIGILQHLAEFLAVLRVKQRQEYLPRLSDFLNTDNSRNWRFRHILSEQLIQIAELYEPEDVREYLVPLALALVRDKVSEVRMVAVRVMAVMVRQMNKNPALTKEVLRELAEQFTRAPKWLHRQIYVYLCQEFIKQNSLPADQFAEDALPHLLFLCWDRVANVRLAIARCLAVFMWPSAAFSDPNSPHCELLLQAIHPLQSDIDADVRYFANMVATDECSCLQHSGLDIDDQAV